MAERYVTVATIEICVYTNSDFADDVYVLCVLHELPDPSLGSSGRRVYTCAEMGKFLQDLGSNDLVMSLMLQIREQLSIRHNPACQNRVRQIPVRRIVYGPHQGRGKRHRHVPSVSETREERP